MNLPKPYEFNSKKPHEFQAYGLIKKIIKDRACGFYIDKKYWFELFGSQIFDDEVSSAILEKPDNYGSLSGSEKAEIYLNNFTNAEFQRTIDRKHLSIEPLNWLINLFPYFFDGNTFIQSTQIKIPINTIMLTPAINHHFNIIFIGEHLPFEAPNKIVEQNMVVITTKSGYEGLLKSDSFSYFNKLHVIIVQKLGDVKTLFDYHDREFEKRVPQSDSIYSNCYVNNFDLQNYFSIEYVKIKELGDKKEVYFLGENGDGKTILLQAMVLALCGKKDEGFVIDTLKETKGKKVLLTSDDIDGLNFKLEYGENSFSVSENRSPYVLAYGAGRFRNDSERVEQTGYATLFSYEKYLESPDNWLKSLDYKEAKQEVPPISLTLAKQILEDLLDNNVKIEVKTDDVWFVERNTRLKFHQLSDGNKSVLVWVCDMLARLIERQPNISIQSDLQGIVFVDEIGLYLHPKWQYNIVSKLRAWFPKIQFIFSTHSPMIILGASKDAVFYRVYKEEGITKISEPVLASSISNQMANGIITAPFLFGLDSARSKSFDPVTQEIDTSDNFVVGHIYKEIRKQLEKRKNVQESEIIKMINSTLENYSTNYQNGKG